MCLYTWEDVEKNSFIWVDEHNKEKAARIEAYKTAVSKKKKHGLFSRLINYLRAVI